MSRGGWQDAAEEVIRLRKRVEELEKENTKLREAQGAKRDDPNSKT